jgi:hypothetical protein
MATPRVNQTNGGGFNTRPHKVEMAVLAVIIATIATSSFFIATFL